MIGASIVLFTGAIVVTRAAIQSITHDEALTWLWFVSRGLRRVALTPQSNNHVLNSLLELASTRLIGPSPLGLRLPALIGATLYLVACERLCRRAFDRLIDHTVTLLRQQRCRGRTGYRCRSDHRSGCSSRIPAPPTARRAQEPRRRQTRSGRGIVGM
jgi:hypothetical protein